MIVNIVMLIIGYFAATNGEGLVALIGAIAFVAGALGLAWFVIAMIIALLPMIFGKKR